MKLYLEVVPFNSSRLPKWLEQHLVSDHLGELIEELVAIRPPPTTLDFDDWFRPLKDEILATGLSRVARSSLRQLLADPPALRELQKAVLVGGGQYWDLVPRSKGFRRRMRLTRQSNHLPVTAHTPAPSPVVQRTLPSTPVSLAAATNEFSENAPRSLPMWAIVAAIVATVAVSGLVVWLILALTAPTS